MMAYLATAPIRKLPKQSLEWEAILSNNFKATFDETAFDFQYRYRMKCISQIYSKELIATILIGLTLIVIDLNYYFLFKVKQFEIYQTHIDCLLTVSGPSEMIMASQLTNPDDRERMMAIDPDMLVENDYWGQIAANPDYIKNCTVSAGV